MTKLLQTLILLSFVSFVAPVQAGDGSAASGNKDARLLLKRDFADFSAAMRQPQEEKLDPPQKRLKTGFGDFSSFQNEKNAIRSNASGSLGPQKTSGRFNPTEAWRPKVGLAESTNADFMVVMATMFPKNNLIGQASPDVQKTVIAKQNFFKRLMLLLLLNPPRISNTSNDPASRTYDNVIPMASYLMRGGRLMLDMVNVPTKDFMATLLGNEAKISFFRKYASHGMDMKRDGTLFEAKLSSVVGTIRNVVYGFRGRYFGVDMPLGGFGNQVPTEQDLVGEGGGGYQNSRSNIQHGHVFIHPNDFGFYPLPGYLREALGSPSNPGERVSRSGVLIGIEVNAPGTMSPYGKLHNWKSGFDRNTEKDPSLTNSPKWGQQSELDLQPKKYGGMVIYADSNAIKTWAIVCDLFSRMSSAQQEEFLAKWLKLTAKELKERHREMMGELNGLKVDAPSLKLDPRYSAFPEDDGFPALEGNLKGPAFKRQQTDVFHSPLPPLDEVAPGNRMAPLDSPHRRPDNRIGRYPQFPKMANNQVQLDASGPSPTYPEAAGGMGPKEADVLSVQPSKQPPSDLGMENRSPNFGRPLPKPPLRERSPTVFGKMPVVPQPSPVEGEWIQPGSSPLPPENSPPKELKRRGTNYSLMPGIPVPAR